MDRRRDRARSRPRRGLPAGARSALKPEDLTVVVLARDEAPRLASMLARLPRGARIFVLDAESTDETAAVARAQGATVETRPWKGFVDARRYALARVETPWALMLDADELLDEQLRDAIVSASGDVAGYRLRRLTALCGMPVRTAGWSDEHLLRLFRTDRARLVSSGVGPDVDVHERWVCDGPVGDLPGALIHDSYPTLASYRAKFERYTTLEANRVGPSVAALAGELALFPLRVLWSIARYRGWNDGWRGLFVAWESARYRVVVRSKALRGR